MNHSFIRARWTRNIAWMFADGYANGPDGYVADRVVGHFWPKCQKTASPMGTWILQVVQEARLLAGMGSGEGAAHRPRPISPAGRMAGKGDAALTPGQPGRGYAAASSVAWAAGWALVMKSTAFWAAPAASTTARRSCLMMARHPSR